ncbi:MAG: GNAT family N-acetyltransferase [Patescibacteria group bacterium]|nr:GNAT family N-acetyltransferase [Patescibacteria group bacterium]
MRLRIPSSCNSQSDENPILPVLENSAIIREVHTYGKMAQLNQKSEISPQHIGLGKKLLKEAERITKKESKLEKIAVISGIGAREYYRKFGYKLKDGYIVKDL